MKKAPAASLKSQALRMLATREHSQQELRRKLKAKAAEGEDVEAVVQRMVETGLQSDARFAESFVRARGERFGSGRIRRELAERGVSAELAGEALAGLEGDEVSRARSVWARKFAQAPQDAKEWAKQARFLQSRGFSSEVIRRILKEPFDESA